MRSDKIRPIKDLTFRFKEYLLLNATKENINKVVIHYLYHKNKHEKRKVI